MRLCPLLAALLVPLAASAAKPDSTDPTLDIQLFQPAPGASNFFTVESGDVNSHKGINVGLNFDYAHAPLAVRILRANGSEEDVGSIVANRFDATLLAAFGLFEVVDLGIAMPLVVQGGFDKDNFSGAGINLGVQELTAFAPGDLRIVPKIRFLQLLGGKFSAALVPTVIVPTGTADYARENNLVVAPSLALSATNGFVRGGLNLGYRYRDKTQTATLVVDDEYFVKAALGLNVTGNQSNPFEVVGEVFGHTAAGNPFAIDSKGIKADFERARTVVEGDVGVRFQLLDHYLVSAGVGGGLMPGYGAPAPRVFATLMYYTGAYVASDADQDGIPDSADGCVDKPEDKDTFEDLDGCPETDNDKDGVVDEDDQCPVDAEDKDKFSDEDGCPDPDNDKDGLLDAADTCPTEAEDIDTFEDTDGCPEADNDKDGIADADDKCPNEPEDKDGYLDFDGCLEADNDGDGLTDLNDVCPNNPEDKDGSADDDGCEEENDADGIPDALDKCPNEPEIYNGIDDSDGCPEKLASKSLVEVKDDKIEIKETVLFATGTAKINPKSFKLLDQVVSVLKNYKHLTKVRVEGHTDDKGARKKNIKLSKDRAMSVRQYLIDKGVAEGRLEAEGFGPDKPIASNKTTKGREMNRRVEFIIAEQKPIGKDVAAEQPAPPPPPAGGLEMDLPPASTPPPPAGDAGFEMELPPATTPPPAPAPPVEEKKPAGKKGSKKEEKKDGAPVEFEF